MRAIGVYICFLATLVLFKLGYLNWWGWIVFIVFAILTAVSVTVRMKGV